MGTKAKSQIWEEGNCYFKLKLVIKYIDAVPNTFWTSLSLRIPVLCKHNGSEMV